MTFHQPCPSVDCCHSHILCRNTVLHIFVSLCDGKQTLRHSAPRAEGAKKENKREMFSKMVAIGEVRSTENYLTQGCVYWRESPMVKRPKCSSSGRRMKGSSLGYVQTGVWHSMARHNMSTEHEAQNTTQAQHGQRGPSLGMGHARADCASKSGRGEDFGSYNQPPRC